MGGGTASKGTDYLEPTDSQVVIPAGQVSKTIDIPILNDNVHEDDEYFNMQIVNAYYAGIGTIPSTKVTIVNNDVLTPPTVRLNSNSYTVGEGDHFIRANVVLSHAWDKDVHVPTCRHRRGPRRETMISCTWALL